MSFDHNTPGRESCFEACGCGPSPSMEPPTGPGIMPLPSPSMPEQSPSMPEPGPYEGPNHQFALILERLDDLADKLEEMGMPRLAAETDLLSNSLETVFRSK